MSTKTERKAGKRADARAGRVPPVSEKLAQLKAVVRDLGAATEAITSSRPPAAVRERFTEAVGQAHATVQEALATLRAVESLLEGGLAEMPRPDAEGYYPAAETLRAILAHQLAERRQKAGLTQAELARRAGVRQETVSRLEGGKHAPTVRTVEKIDRALSAAGA